MLPFAIPVSVELGVGDKGGQAWGEGGGKNRKTRKERKSEGVQTVGQTQPAAIAAFTGGTTDTQRQKGGAKGELTVVLGRLLRRQNERSQTGERLRHLQKLMLREEVRGGEEEGREKQRKTSAHCTEHSPHACSAEQDLQA